MSYKVAGIDVHKTVLVVDRPGESRSRVTGFRSCYGLDLAGSKFVFDRGEHAQR